jgi:hypothetical protein
MLHKRDVAKVLDVYYWSGGIFYVEYLGSKCYKLEFVLSHTHKRGIATIFGCCYKCCFYVANDSGRCWTLASVLYKLFDFFLWNPLGLVKIAYQLSVALVFSKCHNFVCKALTLPIKDSDNALIIQKRILWQRFDNIKKLLHGWGV